jgi:CRP/FNR family transcriptional regulator
MKPRLTNVSCELKQLLESTGRKHAFRAGEEIFAQGEKADFLPIVISGRVKMMHFLDGGKEVIIGVFGRGEMFAVPPVVDGKEYPATAIAMENSRVLMLDRPDFLRLLNDSPELSLAVIKWMSEMLREKTATIRQLATSSPEHRVGMILLRLLESSHDAGAMITLRRQDIARMAGLTTETTIRVVRRLAKKDLIEIEKGKIYIRDASPLRRFTAG